MMHDDFVRRSFSKVDLSWLCTSQGRFGKTAFKIAASRRKTVLLQYANEAVESLGDHQGMYDLAIVYDVLHNCTDPLDLIKQVKVFLKSGRVWIYNQKSR
jgi:hypothetical protein